MRLRNLIVLPMGKGLSCGQVHGHPSQRCTGFRGREGYYGVVVVVVGFVDGALYVGIEGDAFE